MKILIANFAKMAGQSGGLAKVCCAFSNEMVKKGHNVTVVYSDDDDGEFFFPIESKADCKNLRHYDGVKYKFPISYKIKRELFRLAGRKKASEINNSFTEKYLLKNAKDILEKCCPDVIICFQPTAAKTYLSDLKTQIPVILMSHGDPADWFQNYPDEEVIAAEKSTVIQVLMPSFEKLLEKRYPETRIVTIGNVVPQYEIADLSREKGQYKIIFIGRLARGHKRPHLLIEAFISIADKFPEWIVEIWGADDTRGYREHMQGMVQKAGLSDRILFKGTTQKVESVLADGDIFVFPSAYEGFGLTVAEGMSKGLPAIAYKNCPAVNEIITDGVNGFLVDDGVKPLAEKMEILMANKDLRIKMGQAANESMKQYAADVIWGKWQKLIDEVTLHT